MDLPTRLSFLFGSEEDVHTRRQLALFREKLLSYAFCGPVEDIICSGSFGEGIAYPPSDDDLMITCLYPNVVKTYEDAQKHDDVIMIPSEYSPGYCVLLSIKLSELYGREVFFTTKDWIESLYNGKNFIHGPCVSRVYGNYEYDFGKCIKCSFWPEVGDGWVARDRFYGWPSAQMVQTIISQGCHLMPIGNPDSPACHLEWRVSFSVAERYLMHSFNHTQFLVYNLLRISLKKIIDKHIPEVFCSYFMKTTLFHTIGNTPSQHWNLNNLHMCFKSALITLLDFIDCMNCPSFFIPDYNLFKRKINRTNRYSVLEMIRSMLHKDISGVLYLSGENRCLDEGLSLQFIEWKEDAHLLDSLHLAVIFEHFEKSKNKEDDPDLSFYPLRVLSIILRKHTTIIHTKVINVIIRRAVVCCSKMHLDFLCKTSNSNKWSYNLHQKLAILLRIGHRGDVTSGKLSTATYNYMTGRAEASLSVIRQLFSEYPPYILEGECGCDVFKRRTYIEVMCSKKYTSDYKAKHSWAPGYQLPSDIPNAFPQPFRIWITIEESLALEPLTYAYVLECLCYVLLKKLSPLLISTRSLINHIRDLNHQDEIVHARVCVGIIKYVQYQHQSACRWFGFAYKMKINFFLLSMTRYLVLYQCMLLV